MEGNQIGDGFVWSVYVNGAIVNDRDLTKGEAKRIALMWKADGYDDVQIAQKV